MDITAISDLHGYFPRLKGGDLLIVAGDLTARGSEPEYFKFFDWLQEQKYRKKILVAGNHDTQIQDENYRGPVGEFAEAFEYLCDSGTEFDGLKIWGSPWTKTFHGMNPHCKAFTVDTEVELSEKWEMIPDDTDILITHSPALGTLDEINDHAPGKKRCAGSFMLAAKIGSLSKLKLHVCGHIHEGYGMCMPPKGYRPNFIDLISNISVNASHVNERYEPVNKPIRIEL